MKNFLAQNKLNENNIYSFSETGFAARLKKLYLHSVTVIDKCIVCESKMKTAFIYPQRTFRPQEDIFLMNPEINQNLFCCDCCGLIAVKNRLFKNFYYEYINSFYNNGIYPKGDSQIAELKNFSLIKHLFVNSVLQDLNLKKRKLLEVSSYYGFSLDMYSKCYDVFGVEPENKPARFSVDFFPALRGRIINDLFENSIQKIKKLGPFDIVLFSFSFRQIAYIEDILICLQEICRSNSVVILNEGVFSDYIFFEEKNDQKKHFFHNKANYFLLGHIEHLFSKIGFQKLLVKYSGSKKDALSQSLIVFQKTKSNQKSLIDFDALKQKSSKVYECFSASFN